MTNPLATVVPALRAEGVIGLIAPAGPAALDVEKAGQWMRWYNSTRIHRRHGMSRWSKWLEITQQQLRLVDVGLARRLLTHEPESPKVDRHETVRFDGRIWNVSTVPGLLIGERIHGPIGHAVDTFAIISTVLGVATSLGLGVITIEMNTHFLATATTDLLIEARILRGGARTVFCEGNVIDTAGNVVCTARAVFKLVALG